MKKRNEALQEAIKNYPEKGLGLAKAMGVSWQLLYSWKNPPSKYIRKLSRISGIEVERFLPEE